MDYTKLKIKTSYESDIDDLISDFYIPMMSNAKRYDRIAGFFSSTSLAIAARGIAGLIENGGTMRLVTCPRLSKQDTAVLNAAGTDMDALLADSLIREICEETIQDSFQKNHVAALGWMLAHNYLEIKIALICKNGQVLGGEEAAAIMHQKVGIFYDTEMHAVSFSGSNNESASGWLENVEEFKTFREWVPGQVDYLRNDQAKFEAFWSNRRKGVKVVTLPIAVRDHLIRQSECFDFESISLKKYYERKHVYDSLLKKKPLQLFSYQEEAVGKWADSGYRLLLEMATGTGKTRTAIGCMKHILEKEKKLLLFVVSCPQSNLSAQWKRDIEGLDISFSNVIVCDGTVHGWRTTLNTAIKKLATGLHKTLLIYTTHQTCSSDDFIAQLDGCPPRIKKFFIGDEVHGMGAAKTRRGLLPSYNYRLGLSATPSRWFDEDGTRLISDYFGNQSFVFSIHDAQCKTNPLTGRPFLVNYYYHPRFIHLSNKELEDYKSLTAKIIRMSGSKSREELSDILQNLMFLRADIEKNAEEKYAELERILDELGEDIGDTIIFVSDEQINKVLKIMKKRGIIAHRFTQCESATPSALYGGISARDYLVKQFAAGNYQVLVAIKCLDEGIDIPSASKAIVMASSTNPREYIQRIGRVIRQAPGKGNAMIFDMIIHPDVSGFRDTDLAKMEIKIFRKEMDRVKELSENALNNAQVLSRVYKELEAAR